jgi:hypothetical protein
MEGTSKSEQKYTSVEQPEPLKIRGVRPMNRQRDSSIAQ